MRVICILSVLLFLTFAAKSQVLINEVMAANATSYMETTYYNFPDWIELYNNGSTNVLLSNYYISDDVTFLKKWRLPATFLYVNKYYILYCDKVASGQHTNFGLDTDKETLILSDNNGKIIDSVTYKKQKMVDVSYGRDHSLYNWWFWCTTPTPGTENIPSFATQQLQKAEYSVPAGRLLSLKNLTLTGNKIKYTLNGDNPGSSSSTYNLPITINKTMVVKTQNTFDNYFPSDVYANTYFVSEHKFTLPVISLSINPDYLNNATYGIYVEGTNGIEGNCYGRANWNRDWERAGYMEYFDENGIKQISQMVGIKIAGACSRSFASQKSFSVYARGKYGEKDFEYPFFKQKPEITSFNSILLRNSGNDVNVTQLRDGFLQALVNKSIDLDIQSFQPSIIYLNGSYWGIMNIREKINEDYFPSNYGVPRDSVDFIEGKLRSAFDNSYLAVSGSAAEFNEIISFISSNSLADSANYHKVISQIDLQEYLNYMAFQIYVVNTDWPGNNLKFWKKKTDGKWRWIVYDTDFGFGAESYDHRTIEFATEQNGPDWPNPLWSTIFFSKLMENEDFKKDFIRTILTLRNTTFNPEWCNYVMDSLSGIIDFEITYHKAKWGGSKADWTGNINSLKQYAVNRYNFIPGYISSYFNLTGEEVVVSVSNPDLSKGDVAINESKIMNYPFSMNMYKDLKLSLKAIPAKGYVFKNWKYVSRVAKNIIIPSGSEWSYLDSTGYPVDWNKSSFDDSNWKKGFAQLGYGDGDENTVISFGSDAANKIPTALFRKKFTMPDTSGILGIELGLNVDDGVIVYLNGTEIHRDNMPEGNITFNTYAPSAIESSFAYYPLDKNLLSPGENYIACEVHQAGGTSSDLGFDLSLSYTYKEGKEGGIFSDNPNIISDSSFTISVEPVFESIDSTDEIYLNEIACVTSQFRDELDEKSGFVELHNKNDEDKYLCSFFLSDDKTNLTRYAIPDSTVIPANGYIIFYLDGEAKQSGLHASFKANPEGESMILSQKVGGTIRILDSVSFEILYEDHSFGKYEDGTGSWFHMEIMTPGNPNNADLLNVESISAQAKTNIRIFPNPSNGQINIVIKESDYTTGSFSFDIIDLSGRQIIPKVCLNSYENSIYLSQLENGLYLIRVYRDNFLIDTNKLIINK